LVTKVFRMEQLACKFVRDTQLLSMAVFSVEIFRLASSVHNGIDCRSMEWNAQWDLY